ncbi:MAG TPA: 23S rRNA (guanosine(2251)-2'-O)-methyltransferase RlmB [Azospirillum sp.]
MYGVHPVAAAWVNPERRVRRLLVTDSARDALAEAFAEAKRLGISRPEPTPVERAELDRMLPAGAVHQGVALDSGPLPEMGLDELCAAAAVDSRMLIVVLDQVTDPHNVGAILRSAAAFGARGVLVTERHAPEVTGVLAKSASGALEAVPLIRVGNLAQALKELQQAGFWCVGLAESGARTLSQLDLDGRTAIVLGAEGPGLRRLTMERCDEIARLPTGGPIGSLNVSNAAAVALYEVARRR